MIIIYLALQVGGSSWASDPHLLNSFVLKLRQHTEAPLEEEKEMLSKIDD